jgi:hypothetical protein
MAYTDYEKCKWEAMCHAVHRCGLGSAGVVRDITADPAEQERLYRELVLEMFDEGLMFATYATYTDAYNLKLSQFERVGREALVAELQREAEPYDPETVETREWLWVFPTAKGLRTLYDQPHEAFLDPRTGAEIVRYRAYLEGAGYDQVLAERTGYEEFLREDVTES